jgi:hypothetical protein
MSKKTEKLNPRNELCREYDLPNLRSSIREKYEARYKANANLALLSPGVAGYFPTARFVESPLDSLIRTAKRYSAKRDSTTA